MPEKKELKLKERTIFGSRASRRLRRSGHIPGVIYGRGGEELTISVSEEHYMEVVGYSTSVGIVMLKIGRKTPVSAIIKEVQWDILTDKALHIDFLRVSEDQIITVPVHIHLIGTPEGVKMGGVLEQTLHEVDISVRAKDIPSSIEVDVNALNIGDTIHIEDVSLPEGMTSDTPSDFVVASVVAPTIVEVEVEEEEEELLEGEELPEGEDIPADEDSSDGGTESDDATGSGKKE